MQLRGVTGLGLAIAMVLLFDFAALGTPGDHPSSSSSSSPTTISRAAASPTTLRGTAPSVVVTRPLTGLTADAAGFAGSYQLLWESDKDLDRDLTAMASTQARWFRIDVSWPAIERTRGQWDWGPTDRVIRRARELGFEVLGTLAYTPAWNRPAGTTDKWAPIDHEAYAAFATEAVRRYQPLGVRHWEIWNEPNQAQWWQPRPDPAAYADLLQRASRAVKAADPSAVVVTGGLAPAPDSDDGQQLNAVTFLRRLYESGAGGSFDAVGMHPYSFPVRPMYDHPKNAFATTTPALHQLMADHGDGDKKIWLTEYGAPTHGEGAVSDQSQADFLDEAFQAAARWTWAGPLFVYQYRDTGIDHGDREQNFGLVRRNRDPKPAWRRLPTILSRPRREPAPSG